MPKRFQYRLPDLKRALIALSINDNGAEEFHHPSHWDFVAVIRTVAMLAFIIVLVLLARLSIQYHDIATHAVNGV